MILAYAAHKPHNRIFHAAPLRALRYGPDAHGPNIALSWPQFTHSYLQGIAMTEKPAVRISYEDHGTKGRFVAHITGIDGEGELTISKVSEVLVIADHTFVPDAMRGTGAASALVEALIADARDKTYRIMPLCPFVRAQSLKHPEWADVIQQ